MKKETKIHASRHIGTPEELKERAENYFLNTEKPTITGLCYHLGFESRQSFYDYENKPDFTYTIKRSRLRIESIYETRLHGNSPTGAIFALKNMGWTDQTNIDHTSGGEKIQPLEINVTKDENAEKYKQHIEKLAQLN